MNQVPGNETYVSAKQNQARTHSWVSRPHGDQSRQARSQAPAGQRPRAAYAVIRVRADTAVVTSPDNPSTLAGNSMYRFQKGKRLLNAAAFGRVFKRATASRDKWFTVLSADNDCGIARLGLAISKKHCRPATDRNRIKRIIRESFRQHQAILAGLDIVVINRPEARAGSNRQLFDSLHTHWQRCEKVKHRRGKQDLTNG
jgi:ribonuclease P protein component